MATARRVLYFIVYILGCSLGIVLVVYGFLQWKVSGFSIIGSHFSFSFKSPPNDGAWFVVCFIGVVLFAYGLFGALNLIPFARRRDLGRDKTI
jgi:uncharacterized membrane protein